MNTQAFDKLLPVDKRKEANGKGWREKGANGKGTREDNEQMEMEQKKVEGKRRKW